jgi:hypothetical protein
MDSISYSNLRDDKELVEVPYSSGSDYSGDTVTRANYLFLKEQFKDSHGVYSLYGDHGTYAIAYKLKEMTIEDGEKINDYLESLENYPLLDEDVNSKLEMELLDEAFDRDHKHELSKYENENDMEIPQTIIDKAREIFRDGFGDIAFCETGCVAYINWGKIICKIDSEEADA